jgi:hypothetical protein
MSAYLSSASHANGATRAKCRPLVLLAVAALAGLPSPAHAQVVVDLGSAANFALLAGSAITFTTGPITITGNVGSSPTPAVTGLGNVSFVTGADLSGTGVMATAKTDLTSAFNAITGQTATVGVTAFVSGATLTPGVYAITSTTTDLTGTLTLNGGPSDVFIFKLSSTLTTASGSQILLTGGVQAGNVFWQVGSSATLGGGASVFVGNVLALTSIDLGSGSLVTGRLLAENGAVTLAGSDTVTAVPEPATNAFIAACAALGFAHWRRRRGVRQTRFPAPTIG